MTRQIKKEWIKTCNSKVKNSKDWKLPSFTFSVYQIVSMVFILFAAYAIAYYVKLHYFNKEFFKKLEEYYAI